MGSEIGDHDLRSKIDSLLKVSKCFLRYRRLSDCRKYAIQAQQLCSDNPAAAQILTVADVLVASEALQYSRCRKPDWYFVLRVPRYSTDAPLIRYNFQKLCASLNPNCNGLPFASEALTLVIRAWAQLSNPLMKSEFDAELRALEQGGGGETEGRSSGNLDANETFWTRCPSCHFVYEYEKAYEGCRLRCQNELCKGAFLAAAVSSPPSMEVADEGWYWCFGANPSAFHENARDQLSKGIPSVPGSIHSSPEFGSMTRRECSIDSFIDISDNDGYSIDETESKKGEYRENMGAEGLKTEETNHIGASNNERVMKKIVDDNVIDVPKTVKKRKKAVAIGLSKLMGRGIKVSILRCSYVNDIRNPDNDIGNVSARK